MTFAEDEVKKNFIGRHAYILEISLIYQLNFRHFAFNVPINTNIHTKNVVQN